GCCSILLLLCDFILIVDCSPPFSYLLSNRFTVSKLHKLWRMDSTNYGELNAQITILLRSRELLDVCENELPLDASTTAKNKWNKASFDAVSLISSRVSHRVFIEVVKHYSKNAHLLWTKLQEQYASKKAINRGRV
ncbi:hypothetical protein O181_064889, partial [Austropuccinia psidii MF-1]|nr:hypothetical protein [Austropuccinia psidii MF-1]